MKTVVLDTNFILHSVEHKIDILHETRRALDDNFQLAILTGTLNELHGKRHERLARQVLTHLPHHTLPHPPNATSVDHALQHLPPDHIIATNDKHLKEKLKNQHKTVLTIRQKTHYALM